MDTQLIDWSAFDSWLKSRNLAPDQHRPYYLRWVRRFLGSRTIRHGLAPADRIRQFADELARDQSLSDWLRQQGVRAVELYLNGFLKTVPAGEAPTLSVAALHVVAPVDTPEGALNEMRNLLRLRHYSYRTELTYVDWSRRFFAYAAEHRLDWKGGDAFRSFLSWLALDRDVAAATQNQAFNALLFLHRDVLGLKPEEIRAVRAKRGPKLPVVLSVEEVQRVLQHAEGIGRLMLQLIYGAGLRVSELTRLRVQDLDFASPLLFVRAAKGDKDRTTLLPRRLIASMQQQLVKVKAIHERDLAAGYGAVYLPGALAEKYPNAPREWGWQYVFPAATLSIDPRGGRVRRHHIGDNVVQNAMRAAVIRSGIAKHATVHTLRHSFATHLLLKNVNIREVQQYLGHQSVETTMIYTHVIRGLDSTAESPLDLLER